MVHRERRRPPARGARIETKNVHREIAAMYVEVAPPRDYIFGRRPPARGARIETDALKKNRTILNRRPPARGARIETNG